MSFHIYRKFLRSMEVVNVCVRVCRRSHDSFILFGGAAWLFFPLLLVMVVSAEVDWQMHARNPHSPFQRQHMMDCDLSAQQDTGTMQAVIGQVWSQPFLNSPFFPQGSHHMIHIIHIYSTIFLSVSPATCQRRAESARGKRHPVNLAREPPPQTSTRGFTTKIKTITEKKNPRTDLIYNWAWMFKKKSMFQNLFSVEMVSSGRKCEERIKCYVS